MRIKEHQIRCRSKIFSSIEFTFTNDDDKKILEDLVNEGKILAENVNPSLARDSSYKRDYDIKIKDCIGGVVAEYCWRTWLNTYFKSNELDCQAKKTLFETTKNQIDIKIVNKSGGGKTIEVRSSFANNGVDAAVCRNFKTLGPYYNNVKTIEYTKDYHVMVVYSFSKKDLMAELQSGAFKVYLVGGATKEMLKTSPNACDCELIPYDDISYKNSSEKAIYRVINPIINSYNTFEISKLIANLEQ
jgi:hypothetical protein